MADPLASIDRAKKEFMRDVRAAMVKAADDAADLLLAEMKALTAKIDHDLNELRRLGHPYRHEAPAGHPHSDWLLHIQSGELRGGLRKLPAAVSGNRVEAQIHSGARHTWYVLLGTRFMRPRDFVSAAMITREQDVQRIFENAFLAVHDRVVGQVEPLEVHLLSHDAFPAQLPEV